MKKITIVFHSDTNNTFSVVEKLKETLINNNFDVEIARLIPTNPKYMNDKTNPIELVNIPNISKDKLIILAGSVQGFTASPILKYYLNQIDSLKDKKIITLVTEFFPFPWMGGNSATKYLVDTCQNKGGEVIDSFVINWTNKKRNMMIDNAIKQIISIIK